ncbi:hypothetical protein CE91St19_25270 [Odoribacter laneus]|jgi:death-on-curing family protein|uniref:Fic family protein n=1 Tax=Odoribacter laneus TaxID=626933 RepID=UPI001898E662|nr:Fic family protein [Odoribacter laneus]GKI23125.1 hypothetical protein CE91St19_25270 [Odoribacter laneus]GKI26917.1 hypothetical protein CE91St20_30540 [Odoribacter laneus]
MWQELSDLRASYRQKREINPDFYENREMLVFLYEVLKLTGTAIQKQTFIDITSTGRRPLGRLGTKAYDLWQAYLYVCQNAGTKKELDLSFVQTTAAKVMKHTGGETNTTIGSYDTSLGDFRLGEDYDEIYPLSDFRKIPDRLQALCQDINVRINKVKGVQTIHLAADFMYEFAHIKPFGAGNLEIGLLLMNYIQLYHQEPLIILFAEDRSQLLNALKRGEINQTPAVFENFVASQQIKLLTHPSFLSL